MRINVLHITCSAQTVTCLLCFLSLLTCVLRVYNVFSQLQYARRLQSRICRICTRISRICTRRIWTRLVKNTTRFHIFKVREAKLIEFRLLFGKLPQISRRICRICRIFRFWRSCRIADFRATAAFFFWIFFNSTSLDWHSPRTGIGLGPRCRSMSWEWCTKIIVQAYLLATHVRKHLDWHSPRTGIVLGHRYSRVPPLCRRWGQPGTTVGTVISRS